ncbi:MAG TPA: tRNA (guanosine(46)-N7)-methyltransferase TrmB [Verrucomicrobiae bacterium]|nr:tRNA (guanosine(46)-N7)-methyltransferase TrmB [Verrucomicrobiae bacterium]
MSSNLTAPTIPSMLPQTSQPNRPPREAAAASLLVRLESILERLNLAACFPTQQPLEIELGSGDGSFLIEYARRNPGRNFIGVERLLGRVRKLDRKAQRAGLRNVRAVRLESSYFLRYLLPEHSAAALHIYFPDPWPKRKHRRHRLINDAFPGLAVQALAPGGTVFLRTDDTDYFEQMRAVFVAHSAFEPVVTPETLAALTTDFEREFQARGISTMSAAYQLKP